MGWVWVKALLQLANFTLGPDATLKTEIHKILVRIKAPNSVNASKRKHKNKINHNDKQRQVLMANYKPQPWLKFYEEAIIESEARFAVVQLTSEA